MRHSYDQIPLLALAAVALFVSACATSTGTNIAVSPSSDFRPNNILVIGVAPDYEGRSQFERELARDLSAAGAPATPLYVAAGGNKPIVREAIESLVEEKGYDAVLISRVIDRSASAAEKAGSTATKAVRRDSRPIDLFRYDYEELNEPPVIDMELSVTIQTELFAADNAERVWEYELKISNKDSLGHLITEASEKIVRRLKRDDLIGQ